MSIDEGLKESVLCFIGSSFEKKSFERILKDLKVDQCSLRYVLGELIDNGNVFAKFSNVSGKRSWLYYVYDK